MRKISFFTGVGTRRVILCVLGLLSAAAAPARSWQWQTLDTMDKPDSWEVVTSEGVKLSVTRDPAAGGLRLDYASGVSCRPMTWSLNCWTPPERTSGGLTGAPISLSQIGKRYFTGNGT
jgi:hypothetical protein